MYHGNQILQTSSLHSTHTLSEKNKNGKTYFSITRMLFAWKPQLEQKIEKNHIKSARPQLHTLKNIPSDTFCSRIQFSRADRGISTAGPTFILSEK